MSSNVFLNYMMEELLDKVIQRAQERTWVQKTVEIDPSYFETTVEEILSYQEYFEKGIAKYNAGLSMGEMTDKPMVLIQFYRKQYIP